MKRQLSLAFVFAVWIMIVLSACSTTPPTSAPTVVPPTQPVATKPAVTQVTPTTAAATQPAPTTVPATQSPTAVASTASPASGVDAVTLSGPVTVEFWYSFGGTTGKAIEAVVAAFNKEQAGKITVKAVFQGTQDDLNAKIRAAAQGGGLPQIVTARDSDVVEYNRAGLVIGLDDYIQSSKYGLSKQELDDLLPGVLGRTKLSVYGNRTLAWPMGNSAYAWFYNADVLTKSDIQAPPKTWDELLTQARAIKQKAGLPAWIMRQNQAGPIFIETLWTYGVPWLTSDGKSTNFGSPEAVSVLKMYAQMIDEGTMVVSATAEQDFANGRGAMVLASSGFATSFNDTIGSKFQWGVTLPPQKQGVEPVTEMFGSVNAAFKSNPQSQLASWTFIKYFASAQTQASFAGPSAYFASQKSAASSPDLQEAFKQNPRLKQAFEQVAPHMRLLPQHPALGTIRNQIATDTVNEVLLKRLSPEEGAKKLTALANDALK